MNFLSDLLLATAALGAGLFCWVLSRRLARLTALDSGLGKAIAVLSSQVDDLTRALAAARSASESSSSALDTRLQRAQETCRQLDLMLAALHDLPRTQPAPMAQPERGQPAMPADPHFPAARAPSPWPAPVDSRIHADDDADLPRAAHADGPASPRARILRRRPAGM